MRKIIYVIYLTVFILMVFNTTYAQENLCINGIKEANILTEKGKYDEAILLINEILQKCELSKNDKIQINKLLIINNLAIDNIEDAQKTASLILKIDPNFEADKLRDEPEIIALFQKYKSTIILKGVIHTSMILTHANASKTYSIVNDNNSSGLDNYKSKTSFQFGVGTEYRIMNLLWLQSSVNYRSSSYSIEIPNVLGRVISYNENINFIDIPIGAKFYLLKSKFQPFVSTGINFSFLNSALGELSRDEISDIINRKPQRNQFYVGYFIGTGLSYSYKEWSLLCGINYLATPRNINKEGTRYNNSDAVFKYYYLDNDFNINNTSIYIGLSYALSYKNLLNK